MKKEIDSRNKIAWNQNNDSAAYLKKYFYSRRFRNDFKEKSFPLFFLQ